MENAIVIVSMIIIWAIKKPKDANLLYIIAISCAFFEAINYCIIDIALYYSVCGLASVLTAIVAADIKAKSARVLSVVMVIQFFTCLSLVPNWTYSTNNYLQFQLEAFNAIITIILIVLGVTGSDSKHHDKRDRST